MKRYSLYRSPQGNYLLVYNGTPKLVSAFHYTLEELPLAIRSSKTLLLPDTLATHIHEVDFNDASDIANLPDTHPELYL